MQKAELYTEVKEGACTGLIHFPCHFFSVFKSGFSSAGISF